MEKKFAVFRFYGMPKNSLPKTEGRGKEEQGFSRTALYQVQHYNINAITNLKETERRLKYVIRHGVHERSVHSTEHTEKDQQEKNTFM
jgi:hypothetical protein